MQRHPPFLLSLLLLLFGWGIAAASDVEDGIYFAPRIRIPDPAGKGYVFKYATNLKEIADKGLKLEKYSPDIKKASLESQNNDNSDYILNLFWSGPGAPKTPALVLVVNGQYLLVTGSPVDSDTTDDEHSASIHLTDPSLIEPLGALLKITPFTRHHLGEQFTCKFIPKPGGYPVGGPYPITFQLTNCGTTTICFARSDVRDEHFLCRFTFSAFYFDGQGEPAVPNQSLEDQTGDVFDAPPLSLPSNPISPEDYMVTLKPGETFTTILTLDQYLKIEKEGSYTARGTFHFQLVDPELGKTGGKKILDHILWDDYAAAEFEMKVNPAKPYDPDHPDSPK